MKKGFTLIELLAVIVILAIIATIATPIVLSIINDSKEGAIFRSAEFYLDAVEYSVAKRALDGNKVSDGTYSIVSNGNICLNQNEEAVCTDSLIIKVDGDKPKSGSITFANGEITNIEFNFENETVIKNDDGKLVFGKPKVTLVNHIKNLYSETTTTTVNGIEYSLDETHFLMNDRLGSKDVAKTDGNIRYYGANPNNYIDIGDRDSEGNIIFWRIIGLFKDIEVTDENGSVIKTEDLVKIIREDYLISGDTSGFQFDYYPGSQYDNNWIDSPLQLMLNDAYYKSGSTTYYYTNDEYKLVEFSLDFSSTGLSYYAQNKVETVNWKLGKHTTMVDAYANEMYGYERVSESAIWPGKIALIYMSDYGYSINLNECQTILKNYNQTTCKNTNWLNSLQSTNYTLTSSTDTKEAVFAIGGTGGWGSVNALAPIKVRPALYLKSDVYIVEEKEASDGLKYLVVE